VLVTLTKLFAPIMPFLSETMYQNLVVRTTKGQPESVHLCDYPQANAALIDERLSTEMNALLEVVSLGSAARNSMKIKVRQPVAEIVVKPGSEEQRCAVERFPDQIRDELNVKKVTLHDPASGPLLRFEVKPNMKTLGPKFGQRLREVQDAIRSANPAELAAKVQKGGLIELPCPGGAVMLDADDLGVAQKAPEGWAGVADRDTEVIIDTRLTDELKREGMARDVVRQVQELRKQSGLEMEDRIVLWLNATADQLKQAIEAHRAYIASETLTVQWATQPLNGECKSARVKVEGQELVIELMKAPAEG
jgi:isoleucyl-tRNA synthetase